MSAFFKKFFLVLFFFEACLIFANERLGMNAHLVFDGSIDFVDELCLSMKEAGVRIVRLDVYWNEQNWLKQKDALDKACFYADKYGLKILLSIPQVPDKKDSAYIESWLEMLSYYVRRYDGKTPISVDGETETRFVKVDFFEPMNEPDLKMEKQKLDVPFVFYLMQRSYKTVKSVRNEAKVVMPGLTNKSYAKDLIRYRTPEGRTVADYVDVTNVHFYIDNQKKYIDFLDDWMNLLKENGLEHKPHWVTECGASLWDFSQEDQAKLLPKQNIVVLSKNFEKVFYYQYHAFGGNRAPGIHHQRQNYYAVVDPSISNSYGSFYVNDGKYETAISSGDASKRIYLRKKNKDNFMLYSHSKKTLFRLKTNGVAIGGKGYTMKSVSLLHRDGSDAELWKGSLKVSEDGKQYLSLPATKFWGMDEKDKICVKVDSVADLNEQWIGLKPWQAYKAYKVQSEYFTFDSTIPKYDDYGIPKLNVFSWISPERGRVWAIWADDGKKVKIRISGNRDGMEIVDHLGNKLNASREFYEMTDALVYVSGAKSLNLQRF
ncbi:MAG: glycosyl hydrolase [Fibrobacter sp.]|nr:glycosyl hydrolase [Fibrobacter sp.]